MNTPTRMDYEQNLENPSNYTKSKSWNDRTQYGNILRGIISSQITQYKRENNRIKRTKIAQSIGYLIQIQASLIKDESHIEERLEELERIAGITKRGIIKK